MAHRVIVWAYCVIVGAHSVFLRAHYSMWRYTKSLCSMNKHYCDVHKESSWGFTKPFWCNIRSIWGSRGAVLMVKQNHCEGHIKSMWGHTNFCGVHINYVKAQSLLGHTYVMSHIVIWGQIEMFWVSQYVTVNITQNLCEGHMESLWMPHSHYEGTQVMVRVFKVIVKVTLSLWGGIQTHCVSWKDNVRSPKVIVMVTLWLWESLGILVDAQQVTERTYNIIVKFTESLYCQI